MKKLLYIAGALMLLVPALAQAQSLPFVAAETDAASLGTAGANLVQTGSVANASFSNAAAIPFSEQTMDVAAGYTMWQPVSSNILNVGAAFNLKQKFGVAVGFQYGMNPAYDVTNSSGAVTGQFSPSDMHVNVGLAWRFLPFLSLGANVGYATSSLAEGQSYGALAADVFAMAKFGGLKVTAGVANVGTTVKDAAGNEFCIPGSIAVGAGYSKVFGEKNGIDVLVDADYYFSGWMAVAAGAAYTYNDFVSVRVGYRYGGESPVPSYASVGAGVKLLGIKLDAAYLISSSPIGNTLALSLGYTF
ncbi:MAG: PorV/PorQ family protein [Bacteroidales bacterium]|nr:PorV/PorQ family protein [Bacteroidales bacterium]